MSSPSASGCSSPDEVLSLPSESARLRCAVQPPPGTTPYSQRPTAPQADDSGTALATAVPLTVTGSGSGPPVFPISSSPVLLFRSSSIFHHQQPFPVSSRYTLGGKPFLLSLRSCAAFRHFDFHSLLLSLPSGRSVPAIASAQAWKPRATLITSYERRLSSFNL